MKLFKLAIVTTHPVQYNAPLFELMTRRGKVQPKVFYTWPQAVNGFEDKNFGKRIEWDIPLLDGYEYELVENISNKPGSKSWNGIDCPSLIKRINSFNPQAVLVYGWNFKAHFKLMRYFKGKIPVFFRGDSTLLDEKQGMKKILRRLGLRWIYSFTDKAFYVGTQNKRYFLTHGLKEHQLTYAPHAVDNQRFFDTPDRQYEEKAQKWRKELGFTDKHSIILFAGKFEDKKDPKILVEAFKQLNNSISPSSQSAEQSNKPVGLLMVGSGPLETELQNLGSGSYDIKFLPFQNQSEMPVVYRIGDIFCLPSKGPGETWGLAVNEAMACSRPVLVSDKTGCAMDLVKDNGIIFESGNIRDLAEKVNVLLNRDLKQMGMYSSRLIRNWNYEKICNVLESSIHTN